MFTLMIMPISWLCGMFEAEHFCYKVWNLFKMEQNHCSATAGRTFLMSLATENSRQTFIAV